MSGRKTPFALFFGNRGFLTGRLGMVRFLLPFILAFVIYDRGKNVYNMIVSLLGGG